MEVNEKKDAECPTDGPTTSGTSSNKALIYPPIWDRERTACKSRQAW